MTGQALSARKRPHVVIVGAGFGGLACAAGLGGANVDVTVVDRRNHKLFQPLLYQVATAALSPADIAEPIRRTLARYENIRVKMAEVVAVDGEARRLRIAEDTGLDFDILVIATGSDYDYFGHEHWKRFAPGLKTVHEARSIRHKLLLAFERAERENDPGRRGELLTFVVIGGGPTGVEMAGAISELGRDMIERDFCRIGAAELRVILLEAGPRLLASFPVELATYAANHLQSIGVEILTNTRVTEIGDAEVRFSDTRVPAGCIVWGAGVRATPVARWLGSPTSSQGRIAVASDLSVPGQKDIYVIGDAALCLAGSGDALPALAQVAKQQGRYLARQIVRKTEGRAELPPFLFKNRGNTAVIGRHAAVFDFGRWTLTGKPAWLLWAVVHVFLLVNFEKRILVATQWLWRYATRQRGVRLIDEPDR